MPTLNAGSHATIFSSSTSGAVSAVYTIGSTVQAFALYLMTTANDNNAHVHLETAASASYPGFWSPLGDVSGACFQPNGITYYSFVTGAVLFVRGVVAQSDQSVTAVLAAR